MNNHNNDEPRLDKNPFDGIIRRALLQQQMGVPIRRGSDPSVQSTGTLSGTKLSGPNGNVRCALRNSDGVVTESANVYASITTGNRLQRHAP